MKQMLKTGVTGFRIGPRSDQADWLGSDGNAAHVKTAVETRQSMCCLIGVLTILMLLMHVPEVPGDPGP